MIEWPTERIDLIGCQTVLDKCECIGGPAWASGLLGVWSRACVNVWLVDYDVYYCSDSTNEKYCYHLLRKRLDNDQILVYVMIVLFVCAAKRCGSSPSPMSWLIRV